MKPEHVMMSKAQGDWFAARNNRVAAWRLTGVLALIGLGALLLGMLPL